MSASNSNPESQIITATPVVLSEGQRSLAAIVFTDAANFSAIMSRDEARARRLIGRDLASMRAVCEENGGHVLKSTGDGLLMVFGSAVRAVSCALDIQAKLRQQNTVLPFPERLHHRVGIHLGDVFRQDDDVIGDGVNIAARLEAACWRGCVCVSGTVFEVIKNRLPFHLLLRKQKRLKNIGNVVVCQLRPLGGAFDRFFQAWSFLRLSDPRVVRLVAAAFSVAVFILVPGEIVISGNFSSYEDPLHDYALQLGHFGNSDDEDGDSDWSPLPESASSPARTPASQDEFAIMRFNDVKNYDFAALADWLANHDVHGRNADKLRVVCVSLQHLLDWTHGHLQTYTEAAPFMVRDDEGRIAYEFWADPNGAIVSRLPPSQGTLVNDKIPPALLGRLMAALLDQDAQSADPASLSLWRGLKFFSSVYQITLPSPVKKEMNSRAKAAASASASKA